MAKRGEQHQPNTKSAKRRNREAHGRRAEKLAAIWLRLKGYRIHQMRAKTPHGEIDIVASKGKCLAFIEVKARLNHRQAIEAVDAKSRHRIERAAHLWTARQPNLQSKLWRFDIIAISPGKLPHHLRDAWRPLG